MMNLLIMAVVTLSASTNKWHCLRPDGEALGNSDNRFEDIAAILKTQTELETELKPPAHFMKIGNREFLVRLLPLPAVRTETWVYDNTANGLFLPLLKCYKIDSVKALLVFAKPQHSLRLFNRQIGPIGQEIQLKVMRNMAEALTALQQAFIIHSSITYDSFVNYESNEDVRLWNFGQARQVLGLGSERRTLYSSPALLEANMSQSTLVDDVYALFMVYFFLLSGFDEEKLWQLLPPRCRENFIVDCAAMLPFIVSARLDKMGHPGQALVRNYFNAPNLQAHYLASEIIPNLNKLVRLSRHM